MAVVALLDMLAHWPPFSLPRPAMAPTITTTIMPQISAYSIVVAPRAFRSNDFNDDFMTPGHPRHFGDPCSLSPPGLKISFHSERTLQNFSTPVLVVAVALIDAARGVLLQRRRLGGEHGGLWEFPGGKVEAGESPQTALLREIDEELGVTLDVEQLAPLSFSSDLEWPPQPRRLHVILLYTCRGWRGEIECREGEEVRWFAPESLPRLAMPPLDYPLAAALNRVI
jgi:8-oxo-dGTP diphosphatase